MAFLVLTQDNDELIEVFQEMTIDQIEQYELENPNYYIVQEDDLLEELDEDIDIFDFDDE